MLSLRNAFAKFTIAVLALSCSAMAQTIVPSQALKVIEDNIVRLHEEWNNHDMAVYTSHMTEDSRTVVGL
jgi:hypothetical protein